MTKRSNVSDELQKEYQQLLELLYGELRIDPGTQNIIRVYLKFGGEKLARHGIEIINRRFQKAIQESADESQVSDSVNSEVEIAKDPHSNAIPYSESEDLDEDNDDDYPLDD